MKHSRSQIVMSLGFVYVNKCRKGDRQSCKMRSPLHNSYYPNDRFLGTYHAHTFLEASGRHLITPMHTNRQRLIGVME